MELLCIKSVNEKLLYQLFFEACKLYLSVYPFVLNYINNVENCVATTLSYREFQDKQLSEAHNLFFFYIFEFEYFSYHLMTGI